MMVLFEAKNECFMDIDELQADLEKHYGRKTTMDDIVAYGEVGFPRARTAWKIVN